GPVHGGCGDRARHARGPGVRPDIRRRLYRPQHGRRRAGDPGQSPAAAPAMKPGTIPASAWVGIAGLSVAIFCALFAPWIAPYGEREVVGDVWLPMGGAFLLGTDNLGRDLLSR